MNYYPEYRNLSLKQKQLQLMFYVFQKLHNSNIIFKDLIIIAVKLILTQARISKAKASQQDRAQNPLGEEIFPQIGFMNFNMQQQNGKQIRLQTYRNPAKLFKATLFIFHGLNAHIGQGAHVAKYFAEKGFDVVGFDHRGFGRSQGQPGYVHSIETHLEDSKKFIDSYMKFIEQEKRLSPKFALGLSMGGMTVYHLALNNLDLFDGVILMAPALMHNLPSFVPPLTNILSRILPQSTRLLRPFADRSNRNPVVVDDRKKDKYCFSERACLSTMNMIVSVMSKSQQTFSQFNQPMLIVQGGLDKLVNPEVAFQLYDKSKTPQKHKKLIFYENMWHGIWQEEQIWEILRQCYEWLSQRMNLQQNKQKNMADLKI